MRLVSVMLMVANMLAFQRDVLALRFGHRGAVTHSRSLFSSRGSWDSDTYREARREAEYHASERAKLYEGAEQAMPKGDGAGAKALADQGKWHGDLMHNANARAVEAVLEGQDGREIDLHGLFASESIDVVKAVVDEHEPGCTFTFITGKGLNSDPTKGPVLQPAIKKLCVDQKWSFT